MQGCYLIGFQSKVRNRTSYRDALWELVNWHQRLRPKMEIQDVYKLLYQSVFGVGHIIRSGGQALECLQREMESLDLRIQPDEELVEDISFDGTTVRVNLRPFVRQGLEASKLFEAMKLSAERNQGDLDKFKKLWDDFGFLVRSGAFGFDPQKFKVFDRFARDNKYPVVHHSHAYSRLYAPSYRVVEASIFFESFPDLSNP